MNINVKKFISVYGLKFGIFYLAAFFLLVTFANKLKVDTFFGDILIKRDSFVIYLPFASALGVALFLLVIFEIYKNLR